MAKKRTERLQLLLDDDELAALDDWRFEMRMPSRAAAIRQLMRLGLRMDVDPKAKGIDPASLSSRDLGVLDSPIGPDSDEPDPDKAA